MLPVTWWWALTNQVETSLGRRECKRRADILHVDIDVSRRKWEPAFFDPDTAMEIPGPEKYVLEVGIPSCLPHEYLFAVFHHQVLPPTIGRSCSQSCKASTRVNNNNSVVVEAFEIILSLQLVNWWFYT